MLLHLSIVIILWKSQRILVLVVSVSDFYCEIFTLTFQLDSQSMSEIECFYSLEYPFNYLLDSVILFTIGQRQTAHCTPQLVSTCSTFISMGIRFMFKIRWFSIRLMMIILAVLQTFNFYLIEIREPRSNGWRTSHLTIDKMGTF